MIGRGQPGRFRPFSGPYTGRDLLRASQVRQRPGLLIRKEFQGPGRFGQQGLVLPPARRFQVRPPEVLYGFRLPPAPGGQEPETEYQDLRQQRVSGPHPETA